MRPQRQWVLARVRCVALGACAVIGCGRLSIGDLDPVASGDGGFGQQSSGAGRAGGTAGSPEPTGLGGHAPSAGGSSPSAPASGTAGQSDDGAAAGRAGSDPGGLGASTSETGAGAAAPQADAGGAPSASGAAAAAPAGAAGVPATCYGGQGTSQGGDSGAGDDSSPAGQGGDSGAAGRLGAGGTIPAHAGSSGAPPVPPEVAGWEPCSEDSAITVVAANAEQGCWVGCSNGDVFYGPCDGTSWLRNDEPAEPATSLPLPDGPVSSIVPLHSDPERAYVSFVGLPSSVPKIWETQTQGQAWFEQSNSSVLDIWGLSYNPIATDRLYAYVVAPDGSDSYIDCSIDAGSTYFRLNSADSLLPLPSHTVNTMDVISTIAMYDYSADHLIVGTVNGNAYVTKNGTTERSWGRVGSGLPARAITKIALRPHELDYELWVTCKGRPLSYGVWVSRDNGQTWQNAHAPGLPDVGSSIVDGWYGVSFNPVFPDTLYLFGTEGAYRTDNGGLSWTRTWP